MVSSEYKLNRSISSPAPNTIFDFRNSFFYFFLFFSFLNLFIFYFYQSMTRVEAAALLLYYTIPSRTAIYVVVGWYFLEGV